MRYRLLDLIHCPNCAHSLKLKVYNEVPERFAPAPWLEGKDGYQTDIIDGSLHCDACGWLFPIVDGVPRLYDHALHEYPEWRKKAAAELKNAGMVRFDEQEGMRKLRTSFSEQWSEHEPGDATWIWGLTERLKLFAEEMGINPRELNHPLILDAGCGNGELTAALTSWDAEVVGIDLSNSVVRAEKTRRTSSVHYVQADLSRNPLKHDSFDLIYSSGVLHYAPDPRKPFQQLTKCLRASGRMYVWLYGTPNRSDLQAYTERKRRDFWLKPYVMPLPTFLQRLVLYPVAFRTWLMNRLRGREKNISFANTLVVLFNSLTPYYRSHHHLGEVRAWYESEGMTGMTLSNVREPGFGVYANRNQQSQQPSIVADRGKLRKCVN